MNQCKLIKNSSGKKLRKSHGELTEHKNLRELVNGELFGALAPSLTFGTRLYNGKKEIGEVAQAQQLKGGNRNV